MQAPESTPRRLVWCLPMRTLVEQTEQVIREWFGALSAGKVDKDGRLPRPEDIHVLMGGVEAARWLDCPERPAVIVGTQDMLLSRALMRGYASSRALWPMEFALLHEDTQWVFDEVQLMGAGRATSAQLEAFRRRENSRTRQEGRSDGCPARSLWISATLDPMWLRMVDHPTPAPQATLTVEPLSEKHDRLRRLATARKALKQADAKPASAKPADVKLYIEALTDSVVSAHRPNHLTLAIVNRVERAQALREALERRFAAHIGETPELALVHSRFRSADRRREMDRLLGRTADRQDGGVQDDLIVVATQAVEAGVDVSAAVLFTELAPWSSMVQRFGRANRYAEVPGGAVVHWIDLLDDGPEDGKDAAVQARPYQAEDLRAAREQLRLLADAAPANLPEPADIAPPRRVIRRKDLEELFDTDPDLTGFDVDISPYVRDAKDTDIRVFWRDIASDDEDPIRPHAEELCAVPIGPARDWLRKVRKSPNAFVFIRDPQWRRGNHPGAGRSSPPGWRSFRDDPWPGMTLLVDVAAGGYSTKLGFTGQQKHVPAQVPVPNDDREVPANGIENEPEGGPPAPSQGEEEGHDEDPMSETGVPVSLGTHLRHVETEAEAICAVLDIEPDARAAIIRAARWHDLGKAHAVFQRTMRRGLGHHPVADGVLLAKTVAKKLRHSRAYFRHELASALAFLAHEEWRREADLTAYLIAAHHGKVRMNLRALPRERTPNDERAGDRFARGVREGDELCALELEGGERWAGGPLTLSIMELGWDEVTRESWTERTRDLLARFGPFRLAWMETLVRVADWRASAKEREGGYDDA